MNFKDIEAIFDENFLYLRESSEKENVLLTEADGRVFAGEEIEALKGKKIGPKEVCVLAAEGIISPKVYKGPQISLISVGDEWISVYETEEPGKERDRNSYMMAALVKEMGGKAAGIMLSKSEPVELENNIKESFQRSNIVVMFGKDNLQNRETLAEVLKNYGNIGVICIEDQLSDLEKSQEERLKLYQGGSVINISRDTNCCCHVKNNLIVWLAGESEKIMTDFQKIVKNFAEKYYFSYK